ncbi:CoA-binding protein [Rhizobium halophytocola]|uniref:CoA-binding protein n=1 Tax=Rhizobium halophytocola TaxID=735519 RepID=A0ABS4DY86_9HYPH|nr:CoA-binding protein [Rhizobium halophytocola]MBP1850650.1 putative CoA-binding protein [Rhizobium halophytocola]
MFHPHDQYDDALLAAILHDTRTIALVGASSKPERPSFSVMRFLLSKGYRVFPVNPGQAGKEILGQPVYATLADLPEPVDMVDVFRAADQLSAVVDDVLKMSPLPRCLWGQLTVRDDDAALRAEMVGITVVMDRCPAIEYPRLLG